jgi:uncharacterized protein YqeY
MSLLAKIKAASLELRKVKHRLAALSQTVIGEAEMIGKNDGNREVTDSEVASRIKKILSGVDETIALVKDPKALANLHTEKAWLEGWLPSQMTEAELREAIASCATSIRVAGEKPNVGSVMKMMKQHFDGTYDGKLASTLIKEILA